MGIHGRVAKSEDGIVTVHSEGYDPFSFSISDLEMKKEEKGTSIALTKGVLFKMKELGFQIGAFKLALSSDIFPGAGVSSSACYESLIVGVVSHLYNEDKVSPLDMAKIGQYAENVYFGKPCGLLDQCGTSFGSVDFLDFADPKAPIVKPISFNLPLDIVLINTGGSHANLTDKYARIPKDMFLVASYYDAFYLREIEYHRFMNTIDKRRIIPKGPADRARHFFLENGRVNMAKSAILHNNVEKFLEAIRQSQESSKTLLKNTMVDDIYEGSLQQAVDRANENMEHGAARIMGGGFAGGIICFVDKKETASFIEKMKKYYPAESIVLEGIVEGGPSFGE